MTSPVSSGFRPLYKDVLELFEQICTYSPSSATNESLDFNPFSPNLRGIFFEETGRLRVWAENVGVHRQYKASLDHRLREASHVRSMVLQLLSDLKRFLNEGLLLLRQGPTLTGELSSDSDSDEEDEETCTFVEGTHAGSGVMSDLEFVFSDITHAISSLYRLSALMQNPASRQKVYDYAKIDMSHFEAPERVRINDRYSLPTFLVERFVQANLRRRQHFVYSETHNDKIAGSNDNQQDGQHASRPASAASVSQTVATTFYPGLLGQSDDDRSIGTATSFAFTCAPQEAVGSLGNEMDKEIEHDYKPGPQPIQISIPPPPPPYDTFSGLAKLTHFPCPYCFKIVSIENSRAWRRHVLTDLQPYICTFKSCPEAAHLYTTRKEWYKHELQYHRREWVCRQVSCEQRYSNRPSFRAHLELKHSESSSNLEAVATDPTSTSDILELIETQCEVDAQLPQKCPFCNAMLSPLAMRSHLGEHLIDVALFALPRDLAREAEPEGGSIDSLSPSGKLRPLEPRDKHELGNSTTEGGPAAVLDWLASSIPSSAQGNTDIAGDRTAYYAHDYVHPQHASI